MEIKRILVPVDGSPGAQAALDYAVDLQPGYPAEILIVLALEPMHFRLGAQITQRGENVRMLADEQRLIAEDRLGQLESDLRARGLPVRTLLGIGAADEVILDAAKKHQVDMIVMSTHGRTGLAHALLGSITEKVMRGAPCPVMTIRGYRRKSSRKSR